jgi:hypothetical protein
VSRYLLHVARETRSKLRPPSGLRLAPRARTVYEEIHEERMVPPTHAAKQSPEWNASAAWEHPPAPPSVLAAGKTPLAPAMPPSFVNLPMNHSAAPAASVQRGMKPLPADRPAKVTQPAFQATPASRPAAREGQAPTAEQTPPTPKNARPAPRAPAPALPRRENDQEILETRLSSQSFLINDDVQTNLGLTIPEPVREWLRTDSRRPHPAPARLVAESPVPEPLPEQVIDVTIGKIEVCIESDSKPLLRANRRPEPRAAPAIAASTPGPGQLSRHYLDR